jgi:SpoVK/Ycf46/Vps4 family AAA+-type ATPase
MNTWEITSKYILIIIWIGLVPEGPEATTEQNYTIPTATFADVGGIEHVLQDIREHIEYPLLHPEIYSHIGVGPPRYVRERRIKGE